MIDGGKTVFTAGRDFCMMEMVREACGQYAEGRYTLEEFMDCYERILMDALGLTEVELQAQMRKGEC